MAKKPQPPSGQFGLIPIKPIWCSPSNLGSADLKQICRCDDGSDYAIKETEIDPRDSSKYIWTAHNEYFCYRLAQTVGIASPSYHFIEMPNGSTAFGSRWEGGANPHQWWDEVATGKIQKGDILPSLARIYAFDLFVHNVDRHAGNFLIRRQHFGDAVIAFDYSRSWSVYGIPPPDLPMQSLENTVLVQRQLSGLLGDYVTTASTKEILDKLELTSVETITSILHNQHDSWLTKPMRQLIIDWWASSARIARIDSIRAGIDDGTFL
jgi:hypothetical protein